MGIIIGIILLFILIPMTKKYVDIGHQTFGFPQKHPLMYLIVAAFIALIGLAVTFISENIGSYILLSSAIYAAVIVSIFFLYAIVGFFKSS